MTQGTGQHNERERKHKDQERIEHKLTTRKQHDLKSKDSRETKERNNILEFYS